jgi:MFS family permease
MARLPALTPFHNPRFSLYFSGQVVSNTGTWFQNLALSLVVLQATGSAQALSGVTIAQFLPLLLFGILAGRVADRLRPRTILLYTSVLSGVIVSGLALLLLIEPAPIWWIFPLVFLLGIVNTFDRVAAQALIFELVGPAGLGRAVSISTIALATARSIGPGLAGLAFVGLGPAACMLVNAASFIVVFASIAAIKPSLLYPRPRVGTSERAAAPSPLRNHSFVVLLVVNSVIALLALNLMLVVTSTVALTFGGDAASVGAAHALNAAGAIVGGLLAASPATVSLRWLAGGCAALGGALLANSLAPTLGVLLLLAPVLGLGVGYYHGILNAAAQSSVAPAQLGRAMSLVTLGNYGMAPAGALVMGTLIDATSGRVALLVGGVAATLCAAGVWLRTRRTSAAG